MSDSRYLLSVDNGGTYIKAALFDIKGNQIGIAKEYNQMLHEREGWAEYDLNELWAINCRVMRRVLEDTGIDPAQIACVGFAGQGKGVYPVDEEGKPFRNAISSSDARAYKYCQRWEEEGVNARTYDKLYQKAIVGQPVAIMAWLKDNEPENYEKVRWVFSMKDYLLFRLTGVATAGKGSQSGTCFVDLNTGEYDAALPAAYGIPEVSEKLAPLVWDTELCGRVTEEAAQLCGLKAGTPVSAGMFDVDASAIAMGVIDSSPIFTIVGTHGVSGYIADKPVTNGTVALNSLYSLPDTYLIEEGSPSSAGALEWVLNTVYDRDKIGSAELYGQVNALVDGLDPADSKLIFLPYLTGSAECAISRGSWIGITTEHTKAHLLRAVYEGVAFVHRMRIERLMMNRPRPDRILMAGGATNSDVWVQMFADVFQIPVEACIKEEMGAKGVAICSAVAAGIYPDIGSAVGAMRRPGRLIMPRPEFKDIYSRKYDAFKAVSQKAEAIWPEFMNY